MVIFALLLLSGCSDPLSSDEDAVVKTLLDGPLEGGRYVLFWDGTDDTGHSVQPGTYYARLFSRDFTFQVQMTALAGGGTGVSNDSSMWDPGYQPLPGLEQNTPNPFKIKDGTNLPFTLDAAYSIRLTVRNRE